MTEKAQSSARRKAIRAARTAAGHLPPKLPPAFFLTDPDRTPEPERVVAGLPHGWGVIYRHFEAAERYEIALDLADLCRRQGLVLLIGADPELARDVGADGVHWPNSLADRARRSEGQFRLQTASAHGPRELARLAGLPVDAALISAVFSSASHSAGRPVGPLRLRRLRGLTGLPIYGLGGVNPDNACRISGFAGLAAVGGWKCFGEAGLRI